MDEQELAMAGDLWLELDAMASEAKNNGGVVDLTTGKWSQEIRDLVTEHPGLLPCPAVMSRQRPIEYLQLVEVTG